MKVVYGLEEYISFDTPLLRMVICDIHKRVLHTTSEIIYNKKTFHLHLTSKKSSLLSPSPSALAAMHLYLPRCSFLTLCSTRDWLEMITPAEALLKKARPSNSHVSSPMGGLARMVHSMYTSLPSLMVEYLMLAPKWRVTSGGTAGEIGIDWSF